MSPRRERVVGVDIQTEWGKKPLPDKIKVALHNLNSYHAYKKVKGSKRCDMFIEIEELNGNKFCYFTMQKGIDAGHVEPPDGCKIIRKETV